MNEEKKDQQKKQKKRSLPFFIEFIKFSTVFAIIITAALLTLHVAGAAL
jgi:hypothetical protein